MSKQLYKVREGKHMRADGTFFVAGDPPEAVSKEEVTKFPNKFDPVMAPVVVEPSVDPNGGGGPGEDE